MVLFADHLCQFQVICYGIRWKCAVRIYLKNQSCATYCGILPGAGVGNVCMTVFKVYHVVSTIVVTIPVYD